MKDSIQNKENTKNSFIMMILTLISRLLGIIKARVITTAFGATSTADVINVAFYLPNNLRKIFAEGAITSAFVPSLSKSDDENYRNKLLGLMLTFQIIVFSIIIILFIIFGKQIFGFISAFEGDDLELGGRLLPYFLGFLAFISIANIFAAVLQTDKKFTIYGLAPLFYSITLILFVSLTNKTFGAMSMAYGVLIASIIQFIFTLVLTLKNGYGIHISFNYRDKEFKRILHLWLIVLSSSIASILSQQFSTYLASTLDIGSATAFSNSMIFFSTPYGIINAGFVTVIYPLLSRYYITNDKKLFEDSLSYGIDGMINLFIPATLILMFLSEEFVAVLLQNGKFTFEDTQLTASITYYLVLGLTIIGINNLLNKALIATKKEKISFKLIILQASIDVILSLIFINKIGIIALPIANTISYLVTLIIQLFLFRSNLDYKEILKTIIKTITANIPLIVVLILYKMYCPVWYISGSNLKNLIILLIIGIVLLLVLLVSYTLFKIPLIQYFRRKK
ncbi:MAG: murein biosynthesis integral membrane protein MurJ [Pleomorphochaeta sp.]